MRVALVLLVWGLWLPGSHAKATADAPEVRQLLESAQYWAERQRPDLVRQLMRKLLAIQPRHPKALETLGLAATRLRQRAGSPLPAMARETPARSRAPVAFNGDAPCWRLNLFPAPPIVCPPTGA